MTTASVLSRPGDRARWIALVLLCIFIYRSGLPEINEQKDETTASTEANARSSIFQFPHLLLGVVTLFFYVGAEVIAGDSIINYGSSQHIALSTAKFFTTCTMASMILGYIIGIITIPRYIKQQRALVICAILGLIFSACALATGGYVSIMFIALLGLANSLMWPAIWPLALAHLGSFTKLGSSLLVMGIAGAAGIPFFYGYLIDYFSGHTAYLIGNSPNRTAYIILLPIYAFILFYAVVGHRVGLPGRSKK